MSEHVISERPTTQRPLGSDAIPDDIANALGRLVIAFSQLDYILVLNYKRLTARDFFEVLQESRKKLWPFPKLKQKLLDLIEGTGLDEKRYAVLLAQADDLIELRHDYIHAFWTYWRVPDTQVAIPLRQRLDQDPVADAPSNIWELRDRCLALVAELNRVVPADYRPGQPTAP